MTALVLVVFWLGYLALIYRMSEGSLPALAVGLWVGLVLFELLSGFLSSLS